jgi:glycine cleavage system H lipoate-binding protein
MRPDQATLREEPPCIWVQAGVLSYRPCDRHYECDTCPLFQTLRGGPAPPEGAHLVEAAENDFGATPASPWQAALDAQVNRCLSQLIAGCTLHLDRAYSPGHWWVDTSRAPDLTLGIEGVVLRVLHPVDDIVCPPLGVWLRRSEPCGWIRRGHATIPLHAPIAGEVTEVNGKFLEMLRVWSGMGVGDDWLIRLKAHEEPDAVPGLYRGDQALTRLLKSLQLLKGALREATGRQVEAVGVALADGGEPQLDLEAVLGREKFTDLLDEMFPLHA